MLEEKAGCRPHTATGNLFNGQMMIFYIPLVISMNTTRWLSSRNNYLVKPMFWVFIF
jgi:hypothetical protein